MLSSWLSFKKKMQRSQLSLSAENSKLFFFLLKQELQLWTPPNPLTPLPPPEEAEKPREAAMAEWTEEQQKIRWLRDRIEGRGKNENQCCEK